MRKRLNDYKIEDMTTLLEQLYPFQPQPEVEDSMRWMFAKNGIISVRSAKNSQGPRLTPYGEIFGSYAFLPKYPPFLESS